MESRLQIFCCH